MISCNMQGRRKLLCKHLKNMPDKLETKNLQSCASPLTLARFKAQGFYDAFMIGLYFCYLSCEALCDVCLWNVLHK